MTAVEVGYKLNYRQPKPDPRFKADTQMMMGPLPGHLTHEVAYLELRTSFAARGPPQRRRALRRKPAVARVAVALSRLLRELAPPNRI